MLPEEIVGAGEDLRAALQSADRTITGLQAQLSSTQSLEIAPESTTSSSTTSILTRGNRHVFVNDNDKDIIELGFPYLFPYGRGGFDDIIAPLTTTFRLYVKEGLMQGFISNARRLQKDTTFMFFCFNRENRRKMNHLALQASREGLHRNIYGHATGSEGDNVQMSVGDLQSVAQEVFSQDMGDRQRPNITTVSMSNAMADERIKNLTKRLRPYAQIMPGSSSYFEQQASQLLAMLEAPVVRQEGTLYVMKAKYCIVV